MNAADEQRLALLMFVPFVLESQFRSHDSYEGGLDTEVCCTI